MHDGVSVVPNDGYLDINYTWYKVPVLLSLYLYLQILQQPMFKITRSMIH
jgi:hypothetical protein